MKKIIKTTDTASPVSQGGTPENKLAKGESGGASISLPTFERTTSSKEEINPFERKSSLSRTPPGAARDSRRKENEDILTIEVDIFSSPEEEAGKRKRADDRETRRYEAAIFKVNLYIRKLVRLVTENLNTKREIKETTEALKRLAPKIQINKLSYIDTFNREKRKAQRENKPELISTGTQTDEKIVKTMASQTTCYNQAATVTPVKEILGEVDFNDYREIYSRPWEEAVYFSASLREEADLYTAVKIGNPLDTDCEVVKCTFIEPKDKEMEQSIQKSFKRRYPMLGVVTGDFEICEQQMVRRTKEKGVLVYKQKVVKMEHDNTEEVIWQRLTELKKECSAERLLAIHHLEEWSEEKLKKITQAVFNDTNTLVTIYTTNKNMEKQQKAERKKPHAKEEKTYALVVEREGRNYRDVLRDVRAAVSDKSVKDNIHTIRSTKEDKLLIVLDKSQTASDEVKKLVESRNLKVRQTGQRMKTETIHLRGMDALTTKEEVAEALKKEVGQEKVGEMRPYMQNIQAVTVVVEATAADYLLQKQPLRIGPAKCIAEKRVRVNQCIMCWSYDHEAKDCKGPDRSKLCRLCGVEIKKRSAPPQIKKKVRLG